MQVPHTPPMSINQTGHGDMSSDARPSSDEEEGHSRMRSSSYAGSHSMNQEPVRSTLSAGMHSRPVQSGPICTTPGTCQNRNLVTGIAPACMFLTFLQNEFLCTSFQQMQNCDHFQC